jgi:hypothetical protein
VRLFLVFLLLSFSTGPLGAQVLGVGLKGGVRLTDDLDTYWAISESKRYVVGPMATVRRGSGFAVEVDALYRRVGFRTMNSGLFIGEVATSRARGNSWEFPMLLRKSLWHGVYAGVGYAPRVIHGSEHVNLVQVTSMNPVVFTHLNSTRRVGGI